MKRRLCVDIDNCVAATDQAMRSLISEVTKGRVNFRYDDIREFDYHGPNCFDLNGEGITGADWSKVHELFSEPSVVLALKPIEGAINAIHRLSEQFDIHFATTRKPKARAATVQWLDCLGLDDSCAYSIHFVRHRDKQDAIGSLAAAIDDDLEQAQLFAQRGIRSVLVAHPWNVLSQPPIERVSSWSTIADRLLV